MTVVNFKPKVKKKKKKTKKKKKKMQKTTIQFINCRILFVVFFKSKVVK